MLGQRFAKAQVCEPRLSLRDRGKLQGPRRADGGPPLHDSHSTAQHGSGGRVYHSHFIDYEIETWRLLDFSLRSLKLVGARLEPRSDYCTIFVLRVKTGDPVDPQRSSPSAPRLPGGPA